MATKKSKTEEFTKQVRVGFKEYNFIINCFGKLPRYPKPSTRSAVEMIFRTALKPKVRKEYETMPEELAA